jgi:hypothetical protein
LATVAKPFLTPLGRKALDSAIDQLGGLVANSTGIWSVPANAPIQTEVSKGQYETKSTSGPTVFAEISFVLDVSRAMKGNKVHKPEAFDLYNRASIEVRLFEGTPPRGRAAEASPAGIWHFDVGIKSSPGCHFHAQLPWKSFGRVSWDLPVPRLPSVLVSPVDILDFVLGELFQRSWPDQCESKRAEAAQWAGGQKRRLQAILDWHREQVPDDAEMPWVELKRAKPETLILMQ